MQRDFLHHAQVIIAVSPQITHVDFEYFLKQKIYRCIKFFWPMFQVITFIPYILEQIYLGVYYNINLSDENGLCANECNFKIVFLK